MSRFLIQFSYDGTNYKGYQKQPRAKTIQSEIEKVLKKINDGKKTDIYASGRTDAGVHAYKQIAHFDLKTKMKPEKIMGALNGLLPKDIYIKKIEIVKDKFHARFDAKSKEYIYKINMGEYDPTQRNYIYQHNKRLDLVEMERAMKYIEGENDFTSFASLNKDEKEKNCIRLLAHADLFRDGNMITLVFLGTGFLRYMVRNIVGTLIEIGEGKMKSEEMIKILAAKDRKKAGVTANPEGLYLKGVYY